MPKRFDSEPGGDVAHDDLDRDDLDFADQLLAHVEAAHEVRRHADLVRAGSSDIREMRLLSTPLPVMCRFFWLLKAVASSLKYCTSVPGSGPSNRTLALPS